MSARRVPGVALALLSVVCGVARGQPAPAEPADPRLAALRRAKERLTAALERLRKERNEEVMGQRVFSSRESPDALTLHARALQDRRSELEGRLPGLRREVLAAESWYESLGVSDLVWTRLLHDEVARLWELQNPTPEPEPRRTDVAGYVPPPPPSPALEAALGQTRLAFNLQATPLPEALEMVRRAWKVQVVLDRERGAGDPALLQVTLRAPALSLRAVLDLLTLNAEQAPILQGGSHGRDTRAWRLSWWAEGDKIVILRRRLSDDDLPPD